jgi:hypothetical protein
MVAGVRSAYLAFWGAWGKISAPPVGWGARRPAGPRSTASRDRGQAVLSSASQLGHSGEGAGCCGRHSRDRVVLKTGNPRDRAPEPMPRDDPQGHFAHPPSVVLERSHDGRESRLVPGPQEPAGCPDPQPVVRAGCFTREYPACWRTAKGVDQLSVGVLSVQQGYAACDHVVFSSELTLSFDTFAWRPAPLGHLHLTRRSGSRRRIRHRGHYQPRVRHSPRCGRSAPRLESSPWPG